MRGEERAEVRGRTGLKDGHEQGENGRAKEWDGLCSGKWLQLIRHETRPGKAKKKQGGGRWREGHRGRRGQDDTVPVPGPPRRPAFHSDPQSIHRL